MLEHLGEDVAAAVDDGDRNSHRKWFAHAGSAGYRDHSRRYARVCRSFVLMRQRVGTAKPARNTSSRMPTFVQLSGDIRSHVAETPAIQLLIAASTLIAAAWLLARLSEDVVNRDMYLMVIDHRIADWLHDNASPITSAMVFISYLGAPGTVIGVGVVSALVLFWRGSDMRCSCSFSPYGGLLSHS
jgi:hypothetical protein